MDLDMVVLYSEAFYRSREGLKQFRRKELQPPWEIVPKRNYPLPKKFLKFEGDSFSLKKKISLEKGAPTPPPPYNSTKI